jgi:hypothetical protein
MKELDKWKYKKIQWSFYCDWFGGRGNIYRIIVRDKYWHFWKTYAKSYWLEDIYEIINKPIL